MAKVRVKMYEDLSSTLYFVKSKSLTQAMERATLLAQVLPVDAIAHLPSSATSKKHTLVLTIFKRSATLD